MFGDDMILYRKGFKDFTRKLLELIKKKLSVKLQGIKFTHKNQ